MSAAATGRAAARRAQRGFAAAELAVILTATILLMPTVALFAKVFYQYSVMKGASGDAAAYMASLPPASIKDPTERARAVGVAQQIVREAASAAGMDTGTTVFEARVSCDGHGCGNLVPQVITVDVTFNIDGNDFINATGEWTDSEQHFWQITAYSTLPFSR